jgi:hypothetical protein
MSGSSSARVAWIERVLGLKIPSVAQHATAIQNPELMSEVALADRLQSVGNALRGLRDASAPQAADLVARYAKIMTAAKSDPASAAASLNVLESDIARATSAARGRDAAASAEGVVAYRKLLLRWREAQGTLDANLTTFGNTLLAQPDVQSDPRFEDVKRAVAAFPRLVPAFGGRLENALDAAMKATDPGELAELTAEGIAAIDAYRQQLAAVKPLLELEDFAAEDLGIRLPLHGALDQALVELKQHLGA